MIVPDRFDCRGFDFNKSSAQAELISVSLDELEENVDCSLSPTKLVDISPIFPTDSLSSKSGSWPAQTPRSPAGAGKSTDSIQCGASIPCHQEPVSPPEGALSGAVKEHGVTVYAVWPGQPNADTQAKSVFRCLKSAKKGELELICGDFIAQK